LGLVEGVVIALDITIHDDFSLCDFYIIACVTRQIVVSTFNWDIKGPFGEISSY